MPYRTETSASTAGGATLRLLLEEACLEGNFSQSATARGWNLQRLV